METDTSQHLTEEGSGANHTICPVSVKLQTKPTSSVGEYYLSPPLDV